MNISENLQEEIKKAVESLYSEKIDSNQVQLQKTRDEFNGDLTLVVFPLLRISKKSPDQTAEEIGGYLKTHSSLITGFEIVKGFLNLTIADSIWLSKLQELSRLSDLSITSENGHIMVEYSSPNTNKPLHLGHLRNIFLGHAVSNILKANGHKVTQTQIINDRGIHICKSMLAWEKFGEGSTPDSKQMKGDKFVGHFYVEFDKALKVQKENLFNEWWTNGVTSDNPKVIAEFERLKAIYAEKEEDEKAQKGVKSKLMELVANETPIMIEAKTMLQKWEAQDEEVRSLWAKMNSWVYDGFNATYRKMGVSFDQLYYESDTYITGKELVEKGLKEGVFYKKDDGSVWVDLTSDGLDEKLVLRADGTAVYMTQDIGTAWQRMKDFNDLEGMVYVVGNEQDYHFKVLFLILQKLGFSWAQNCHHLSYGMIDLPTGKMKSREGTVVDAVDLMNEIIEVAQAGSEERGHIDGMNDEEKHELFETIGLGGLKYYLLKVEPKKRMLFNPEESVDLQGNTGPFMQYSYARIASILRKAGNEGNISTDVQLGEIEKSLIILLNDYPEVLQQAGKEFSPALICNYSYELAKSFNSFYQNVDIFREENEGLRELRLAISSQVGKTLEFLLNLLGINVPEKM